MFWDRLGKLEYAVEVAVAARFQLSEIKPDERLKSVMAHGVRIIMEFKAFMIGTFAEAAHANLKAMLNLTTSSKLNNLGRSIAECEGSLPTKMDELVAFTILQETGHLYTEYKQVCGDFRGDDAHLLRTEEACQQVH